MNVLKAYLVKEFGLPADADEASVKKMAAELLASEKLTSEKYLELITPKAAEQSPLDKLTAALATKLGLPAGGVTVETAKAPTVEQVLAATAATVKEHGLAQPERPDSALDPTKVFAGAAAAHNAQDAGRVRVKKASEQYGSTKARKVYPKSIIKNGIELPHHKGGQDVVFEGVAAYDQSEAERAKSGAWQKHKLCKALGLMHLMTDEDNDLLLEAVNEDQWVGDISIFSPSDDYARPKRLSEIHKKTTDLISDSPSGGSSLVPYYFDMDLVTYPTLNGELFPFVDLRELAISNQVKTGTLTNVSIQTGPAEATAITLQTTTSMAAALTSNVFNATGAITVGRDFLSDSPLKLQDELMASYQRALANYLDQGIAAGDGTTFVLGIFQTSSTNTKTAANNTAGPVTVADINGMISALPAKYRKKDAPDAAIVWVSTDSLYFRIKGIKTGLSGDQRLVYGYDLEKYMLQAHPYKITDASGVAGSQLAFGRMDKYRMWRRKGMAFEASSDGKTLMLANELLITMRSRWAGQVIDPSAWVLGSGFSLH